MKTLRITDAIKISLLGIIALTAEFFLFMILSVVIIFGGGDSNVFTQVMFIIMTLTVTAIWGAPLVAIIQWIINKINNN